MITLSDFLKWFFAPILMIWAKNEDYLIRFKKYIFSLNEKIDYKLVDVKHWTQINFKYSNSIEVDQKS
jgi:hypothetical protein